MCLCFTAMRLPYFYMDDVVITGFSAERCGFPRMQHPQIQRDEVKPRDFEDSMILRSHLSYENKLLIYQNHVQKLKLKA